jgi:catalase
VVPNNVAYNPSTNIHMASQDYLSYNPESIHQVLILFSDRGTPDGYHNMHGYSSHTFKFVREDGEWVYVQIHIRADGGYKVATRLGDQEKTTDYIDSDS